MKRVMSAAIIIGCALFWTVTAPAIPWQGIEWDVTSGSASVDPISGNLIIGGSYVGGVHFATPEDFRSTETPWVEAGFLDNLSGGFRLVAEDRGEGSDPGMDPSRSFTEFGSWHGYSNDYWIYWWDPGTGTEGWYDVGARTSGEHSLGIALNNSGLLEYYLDDVLVWTNPYLAPDTFTDISLTINSPFGYTSGTAIRFGSGDNDPPPPPVPAPPAPPPLPTPPPVVPEPATVCLFGAGLAGLLSRFRRKP